MRPQPTTFTITPPITVEDRYLAAVRAVEAKRLELSRIARQKSVLLTEIKNDERELQRLRKEVLGFDDNAEVDQ